MSDNKKMVSIWSWVGLMLSVYGVIVGGTGVFYIFEPEAHTATAHLNPSLWWGGVMIVFGVFFLVAGKLDRNRE